MHCTHQEKKPYTEYPYRLNKLGYTIKHLCSRSDAPTSERQRHSYSQSTEPEKAEFHTPAIPNETRNYVEHNSAENISQDLVHPTKSDIEASASFDSKSEEREEIADVPAFTPAHTPAPALESSGTVPHSMIQKVNDKELWKASQFI